MGATVTCNKRIAAFHHNGEIVYILFEETYEKNCHPHHPSWCAMAFGSIEVILERIFGLASACEGGSLQGRGGHITPEGYIAGWMKALAEPVEYSTTSMTTLEIGDGIYMMQNARREEILEAVRRSGDVEAFDALSNGLRVYRQVTSPVVFEIMKLGIRPWEIDIKIGNCITGIASTLAYRPAPSPTTSEPVKAYRLSFDKNTVFQQVGNQWKCFGWDYSFMGTYIRELWQTELQYPGSYKSLIKARRAACESAAVFAVSAEVVIQVPTGEDNDWMTSVANNVSETLGLTLPCRIQLGLLTQKMHGNSSAMYRLAQLAEYGLAHIEPPQGETDMPVVNMEGMPTMDIPKPQPGLVVEYGGCSYELVNPAGPRKGWSVKRISDNMMFRMPANQIKDALLVLAQKLHKTAMEKWEAAKSTTTPVLQQDRLSLF